MTKPIKWHVRPAKTQISLGICPVWSESLLSAWRNVGSLATHWVHSEDSDQTGRTPRLIWVFAGRTCHFVGFAMRRLNLLLLCFVMISGSVIVARLWELAAQQRLHCKVLLLIIYINIVSVWPNQSTSYRWQTWPIWKNSVSTEKLHLYSHLPSFSVLAEFNFFL